MANFVPCRCKAGPGSQDRTRRKVRPQTRRLLKRKGDSSSKSFPIGFPHDAFTRLLTFPNAFITGHQVFFTKEALATIAKTIATSSFEMGRRAVHEARAESVRGDR